MKTIDIKTSIMQRKSVGFAELLPYVFGGDPKNMEVYWLEYSQHNPPLLNTLANPPRIPPHQNLNEWGQLPQITVKSSFGEIQTRAAVCHRIYGGVLGIYELAEGCLWTMLPEDAPTP